MFDHCDAHFNLALLAFHLNFLQLSFFLALSATISFVTSCVGSFLGSFKVKKQIERN